MTALSNSMKSTQASADKFKETFSQMGKDFENDSELLIEENEEGCIDIPAFSEFYKDEQIEEYRSKILSVNFNESKK